MQLGFLPRQPGQKRKPIMCVELTFCVSYDTQFHLSLLKLLVTCAWRLFGVLDLHVHLVEPLSPLSRNRDLGRSKQASFLRLRVHRILKNDREVDNNHLNVSLAHPLVEILEQVAKQHVIRLTGELVSSSASSRAK